MNKRVSITVGVTIFLLLVLILGVVTPTGRLISTYIAYKIYPAAFITDETVTSGGAWGLSIGQSKQKVFISLRSEYGSNVYINENELETGESGVLVPLSYVDRQFELLAQNDRWKIYFDSDFSDRLELLFSKDQLVSVRRYQRTVEFP